jgi:hypothetical protein
MKNKAVPPIIPRQSLVSFPIRSHGMAAMLSIKPISANRWPIFQFHQITA